MLRRIMLSAMAGVAAVGFVSTASAQDNEPVTLKLVVGIWATEVLTPWVERFSEETGIQVEIEDFPFRDLLQTIEVRGRAQDTDMDVFFVDAPLVPSYAVRGLIQPVSDAISAEDAATLWTSAAIDAGSWDGQLWAPPLNNSSQVLYYNRDLLDAAGVDYPSADVNDRMTWEQLVEDAKKVNDPDNGVWGFEFDQVSRYYQLQVLPESLGGGSGVSDDGFSVDGTLTNDGWIKAFTFYRDLHNTWNISPKGVTPEQTPEMFSAGNLGFFVGGLWNIPAFVDAGVNFGIAPHPYFADGKPATPTNSWHVGVWQWSQHPEEAAKLARFLTANPLLQIEWLDKHGQFPSHNSALLYIHEEPKFDQPPYTGYGIASYEAANTAVTRARTPAFLEFEEIVNNSLEDIRNGGDPETVLSEAEQRIGSAMRRYQH